MALGTPPTADGPVLGRLLLGLVRQAVADWLGAAVAADRGVVASATDGTPYGVATVQLGPATVQAQYVAARFAAAALQGQTVRVVRDPRIGYWVDDLL